jgi:hypothetical protein
MKTNTDLKYRRGTGPRPVATASALALVLAACGGGGGGGGLTGSVISSPVTGGGGGAGSAVTGQSTTGTIDGFGSVFVNGVRYDTDDAEIIIDGETRSEDDLSVGMVVTVQGEITADGRSGRAERILYDDELTGPISSIEPSTDGDALLLRILGFAVIVERTGTRFDDVRFDTLAVDDVVEVSGFRGEGNRLRATRLERKSRFQPGRSEVELTGRVRNLTQTTFRIGDVTIDFSNADLDDLDDGLSEGRLVEVEGTLNAEGVILARDVEDEEEERRGGRFEEGESLRLQGSIGSFRSRGDFRLRGVPVDASSATLRPADLNLGNGSVVQVNGTWRNGILVASSIDARRGRIKVEARVSSVAPDDEQVVLQLAPGTVTVAVDARTTYDDDTGRTRRMTLDDIRSGDFLEVEAYFEGDQLIATLIDRDEPDDDRVRAPVEAFLSGSEVQLLGLTYSIDSGTDFEDADDNTLDADSFFGQLQVGDLVQLEDDSAPDGIADELEFEDRVRLEGEREFGCGFDDDGSSCEDSIDDDSPDDDSFDDDSVDDSVDDVTMDDLSEDDPTLDDDTLDDDSPDALPDDESVDDDTQDDLEDDLEDQTDEPGV